MVDDEIANIGCCAKIQKWLIVIVNFILFLSGVAQLSFAIYIIAGGKDGLGFSSDVEGNDTVVKCMISFGVLVAVISILGYLGAKKENKCWLWVYVFILFFMIMGQVIVIVVMFIAVEYGDSIFESLWMDLEPDTISDIEEAYQCCSFNGDDVNNTWPGDVIEFNQCSAENSFDPMETCWGKFERTIEENYTMVEIATLVILGVQILIYFSTHYVIQSIAEAERERTVVEKESIQMSSGGPTM